MKTKNEKIVILILAIIIVGSLIFIVKYFSFNFNFDLNLNLNWNFFLGVLVSIATVFMAIFAFFTWRLNDWQQKQFKNPVPEVYFSEPQVMAISKNDKKILINFLVYFLNTGLSPIIGSGIEHRIENLETGEKYKFRETRFFHDQDKSFGAVIPELYKLLPKIQPLQDLYKFNEIFKSFFDSIITKSNIEIFNPYPSQKIEELWSLKWQVPSEDYISEKEVDSYWVIQPHKLRIKRYYIKVPYNDKKYYSFKIKLILHYYCGSGLRELLKYKEFSIKPVIIGGDLCLYESELKTRTVFEG